MPVSDDTDRQYMRRALELAANGLYSAHPNPRVGCVIVKNGKVVGEGWHRKTGEAHAEVAALEAAGTAAAGATAYVSLEPCAHVGKTPPCANALIDAGIVRLVAAMQDPDPRVAGKGLAMAKDAGITTSVGLLAADALRLNEGFVSRVTRGRPFVRLKIAASLDGATAMKSGESQWITGEEARQDVQRLRAASGAVLTGIETVLKDDPSLNVRNGGLGDDLPQPVRIVLDSRLRMPTDARMLGLPGRTLVFGAQGADGGALEAAGAEIMILASGDGRPELSAVLEHLAQMEINDVLVETGPVLAGAFLAAGLVDELVIYQSPHIMGSETRGMVETPDLLGLDQRLNFRVIDSSVVGSDTRLTLRPAT